MNNKTLDDYSDIINLPRPVSQTHSRMSKNARAAQFAPYAALVGHRDIIASEEQVAFTKDNIDHEITVELDPETTEDFAPPKSLEILEDLENIDLDFSQENPLDS